jgi:hypothetical protein
VIPLVLNGKPPKIIVLPNLERLIELAGKKAIEGKAGDLLGGFLKGGDKKKKSSPFGF